jgi:hypothetical protein
MRSSIEKFLAQHHRQGTAQNVTADGRISLVKDRTGSEQDLGGFECVRDGHQVALAQRNL